MKFLLLSLLTIYSLLCSGQAKIRRLSTSINHPSINVFAPFVSADGNAMIFLSDNAEDGVLTPFFTLREANDWREPQVLPKSIHTRLNFLRGYGLNADGRRIYVSTVKSPGVGGYDIWSSEWKGSSWSEPVNFGMPINTKENEACASLTPDGNTMYFMRCLKMDQNNASDCRLFSIRKKLNGQWDIPIALPDNINTGNSQVPRIMADGETLILSSDKFANSKGGMDLYITKSEPAGNWSDPQPLEFVNTTTNDQFVSVNALGRYLLRDTPGQRRNEIVEYLFPDELRPKGMMKIEGKVIDPSGAPIPAYITVNEFFPIKQTVASRPGSDGSFTIYLKEGSKYEVSIDPEKDNVTFLSKSFDLTSNRIPQSEKLTAILKDAGVGDSIFLDKVQFKPSSSELDLNTSAAEIIKLQRVLNANPNLKAEIQVHFDGLARDSIQSDADLTEVIYDTVKLQYQKLDSLGLAFQADTLIVKKTFHNDRSLVQAQAVVNYLISQGIDGSKLSFFGKAIEATLPENKKTTVKVVLK